MLTKMCNRPRSEPTSWPGNQAPEDYAATLLPAEPHSQDTVFMVRVQRRFRGWRLMVLSLTTHKGVQDFAITKEQALLIAKTMKETAARLAKPKAAS